MAKSQEETQKDQIIEVAEAQMRRQIPSLTYGDDKTAFLYVGQVKGNRRFNITGLLETDPKKSPPFCKANVTSNDDPLDAIIAGIELLKHVDSSTTIWKYIQAFDESPANIQIEQADWKLKDILGEIVKRQSKLNAYERGASYLNEQMRKEK